MRVWLSDPTLVDDLIAQLRVFGVGAEREDEDSVSVTMPPDAEDEPENPPEQGEVELTFVVRVWQQQHRHAFVMIEP